MIEDVPDPHDTIVEDARNLMLVAMQREKQPNGEAVASHVEDMLREAYGESVAVACVTFEQNERGEAVGMCAHVSLDGVGQQVRTNDFL